MILCSPVNILINRQFSLQKIVLTQTNWSKTRVKVNQPKCHIPRYLLNGSYRKGQGRSGRNNTGRIITRHKGGFHRQNYRIIDFMRVPYNKKELDTKIYRDEVLGITYDPCRSALIAKVAGDISDHYRLILASKDMKIGDIIYKSRGPPPEQHKIKPGDSFPLKYLPNLTSIFNVETYPGSGAKMLRTGDMFGQVISSKIVDGKVQTTIKINDRNVQLDGDCLATCGICLSNTLKYLPLGKAGRARRYGMRPGGKTGTLRLKKKRQKGRKNLTTFRVRKRNH